MAKKSNTNVMILAYSSIKLLCNYPKSLLPLPTSVNTANYVKSLHIKRSHTDVGERQMQTRGPMIWNQQNQKH